MLRIWSQLLKRCGTFITSLEQFLIYTQIPTSRTLTKSNPLCTRPGSKWKPFLLLRWKPKIFSQLVFYFEPVCALELSGDKCGRELNSCTQCNHSCLSINLPESKFKCFWSFWRYILWGMHTFTNENIWIENVKPMHKHPLPAIAFAKNLPPCEN